MASGATDEAVKGEDLVVKAELDATDLKCPLPVLRTRKSMKPLDSGDILKIIATDVSTKRDIPAFCDVTGDALLAQEKDGDKLLFWIRKK